MGRRKAAPDVPRGWGPATSPGDGSDRKIETTTGPSSEVSGRVVEMPLLRVVGVGLFWWKVRDAEKEGKQENVLVSQQLRNI